ncbi:MAG: class F sortase [Patescibacteria group bacterium]
MKFTVKLSVVVALAVFIIGVYQVTTTKAESLPREQPALEPYDTGGFGSPNLLAAVPAPEPQPQLQPKTISGVPVHLSVPMAHIESPVVKVGLNDKGEMDVPSGDTNNVGWYSPGTEPGNVGSAVLDAHVFAALKNLHMVGAGDDIYIDTATGSRLHFRVDAVAVYQLADVPDTILFNRADQPRLNLITCAGTFTPSLHTYDQRLVVYAVLVQN